MHTFTVAWHVHERDLVSLAKEYVNDGYIPDTQVEVKADPLVSGIVLS